MTLADYKKMLNAVFVANTRRGFADWRSCGTLCMDTVNLMEMARSDFAANRRYKELFDLSGRAYIMWSQTDKDDSNGETQDFCDCITEIWDEIYNHGTESVSHDSMMVFFFQTLDGTVVDYMEDDIYRFLLSHFKDKEELEAKERFLALKMGIVKDEMKTNEIRKYSLNVLEDYYIRVLGDLKRPIEEIRKFVKKRNGYTLINLLAEIETEYGNFNEAIAIHKARIAERPDEYWSNEHRKALMDIYKSLGDTEQYNAVLYDIMMANVGNMEYFLEYKSLFAKEEWHKQWELILSKVQKYPYQACSWYEEEGRYDLIMAAAEPAETGIIEGYKELKKLYPERCLKVLINGTEVIVKNSKSRRDYKGAAALMRKMLKYEGGEMIAHELAHKYIAEYPRRTAMIDEFSIF